MQYIWNIILRSIGSGIAFLAFILVALVAGITIYTVIQTGSSLAFLMLLFIPAIAYIFYLVEKRRKHKNILKIRNDWGKEQLAKDRYFEAIRALFDFSSSQEVSKTYIDDQTWRDLNMDQLYIRMDRTLTDPGESVLYKILREPLFQREELASRNQTVHFFQDNPELRERIQLILMRLGHQFSGDGLFNLLWRKKFPRSRIKPLFSILALSALVSLFIPLIFWSGILVIIPVVMFIINIIVHYAIKRRKDLETISFPYLIGCIKTARALSSINHPAIERYTTRLKSQDNIFKSVLRKARTLFPSNQGSADPMGAMTGAVADYFNVFFLQEVRSFYATIDEIAKDIVVLQDLYLTLGEVDSLQSIASYRASLASYSEPEFTKGSVHLEVKDARQPLLEKAVPASINFNKNVEIITGSNMGGKSTFLRNIGNNVLMAQTIATTLTSYYKGDFFRIITSISRTDDLMAGKSFYYVEAERLLSTIQSFDASIPTLCIIDELLSGTNSTERLQASEAIIRYLAGQNILAVIATHDLELAERLDGTCDFYHFTDNVDETGLKFDYLLKPGIATTQNAIALLKYLGYPKEITEKAQEKDK